MSCLQLADWDLEVFDLAVLKLLNKAFQFLIVDSKLSFFADSFRFKPFRIIRSLV